MYISQQKTQVLKGVMISMMVWLHLFNGNHTELCSNLLYVLGVPFAKWLSGACAPVGFFLLFSGYGLAYTREHKILSAGKQAQRLSKLYIHYWMVLLLFIPLASLMHPEQYPGSVKTLLLNAIGLEYGYNLEMWFLFPYCLVSLCSPFLFRIMDYVGHSIWLIFVAVIHVISSYLISEYNCLQENMMLYWPLLFLNFLYFFSLGAFIYKMKWEPNLKSMYSLLLILVSVILMAFWGNSLLEMLYVPFLTVLICSLRFPKWLNYIFTELSQKSMIIWMTHTWFCYYLFQPQIYSLKYPIFIWVGQMFVSYFVALPIMWCAKRVILKLTEKKLL